MSQQSDNLDAIFEYFMRTDPITTAASDIRMSFAQWWPTIGFFARHFDSKVYGQAQQRRIAFDAANVRPAAKPWAFTPEEQAMIDATGMAPAAAIARVGQKQAGRAPQSSLGSVLTLQYGVLKLGSKGDGVKRWQAALGIGQSGTFDATTKAATIKFQKTHGIKGDGSVGPATWTSALGTRQAVHNVV
jgi:murein L,D-transpeptidase YcbB/YkuD